VPRADGYNALGIEPVAKCYGHRRNRDDATILSQNWVDV
jgi:hypothetical protein